MICNLLSFLYNLPVLPNHILIMDSTLIQAIQASATKDNIPVLETGMEIEVHQIIREGDKERIQKFRGLIISMRGASPLSRMITVRADIDGIGIEKIFPVNSPMIAKIEVLRRFKVRRNNIGYIRNLTGKAARLKEIK
jgi:large subunit ribosomal protein L19